jgi:hypothetical protein
MPDGKADLLLLKAQRDLLRYDLAKAKAAAGPTPSDISSATIKGYEMELAKYDARISALEGLLGIG